MPYPTPSIARLTVIQNGQQLLHVHMLHIIPAVALLNEAVD